MWFIKLFRQPTPFFTQPSTLYLMEGTRVKTPFGPGRITNGSVNVALDLGVRGPVGHNSPKPGNHVHVTTTLDKIEFL